MLTAIAYWLGARVGLALTFGATPVSTLWPPNAILLSALLLAPTRVWWILLVSVFPVHVAAELHGGVPLTMVLSWFVSNSVEALLGAGLVRYFIPGRVRLDSARSFGVFVVCASFSAVLLSSFLDAAFVTWNDWGHSSYWSVWRLRFFSNVLATQTIVPIVLATDRRMLAAVRAAPPRRWLEALALVAALLLTSQVAFWSPDGWSKIGPALVYAPIPVLLWAAVRFGPLGISLALASVTITAIWGAVHGAGPFTTLEPAANALSLQLFLFLTGVPLSLIVATFEERKRAERLAAESERMLSLTIRTAHVGIWTADLETGRFTADDVVTRLLGEPATHADAYSALIDHIVPAGNGSSGARTSGSGNEKFLPDRELEVRHADGTTVWILARGMLLRHRDGTPFQITGIAIDVSEQKRVERELRENDERMALVATSADVGFWSFELATGEVWLSDHCYTMIGVGADVSPLAALEQIIPRSAMGESSLRIEHRFGDLATLHDERRILRPDGAERWLASIARLERDEGGRPLRIIGVSRDITEQREAEREAAERRLALAHLSRVATVGELTATIVHEVGQPLGAVALNAQFVRRLLAAPELEVDELRLAADDLLRDTQRASGMIGQLRDILRRNELAREQLDLRVVVQDALRLAKPELERQQIAVAVSIPDERALVLVNRSQLQQVLLNLLLNARDSINQSSSARREVRVTVARAGAAMFAVRVADSGGGIAREHLKRVFEPFFTSKPEGLGLGLAVSRSIMLDHGGDLNAENVDGGALMQLVLPESPPRSMPQQYADDVRVPTSPIQPQVLPRPSEPRYEPPSVR